jgi:hypothetical protein
MENTAISCLENIKNTCSTYIKQLEDVGIEIPLDLAEAASNIEKQVDIEINNITKAPPSKRIKKMANAIVIIQRMVLEFTKLVAEFDPENAYDVGLIAAKAKYNSDSIESTISRYK